MPRSHPDHRGLRNSLSLDVPMMTTTKITLLAIAATLAGALCIPRSAFADEVRWTDWKSARAGTNGDAIGKLDLGGETLVDVTYKGQLAFWDAPGTTTYWKDGGSTYTSPAVDNGPGNSGMVALSRLGTRSVSFSEAVDNVFFAVIGLNAVGYDFDQDFTILSSGAGHLGSGSFSKQLTAEGKYRLTGTGEPHGMILFNGAVSSITWTSLANETWNGFTVGSYGAVTPVPEPGAWAMMGLGILVIGWKRRASVSTATPIQACTA